MSQAGHREEIRSDEKKMKVRVKGLGWERNVMTLVVDFEKEDKKRERAGRGEAIILLEGKKK